MASGEKLDYLLFGVGRVAGRRMKQNGWKILQFPQARKR